MDDKFLYVFTQIVEKCCWHL